VVGRHDGIARYTVGQAKRLGAAANGGEGRRIVVGLDAAGRRVVVGASARGGRLVRLREMNWLVSPAPRACEVKLRAREAPRPAQIVPTPEGADVLLAEPALAAPGQVCVIYAGERVLGGGFIRMPDQPD
jgi:tRNA-specific 2-thiouridylase